MRIIDNPNTGALRDQDDVMLERHDVDATSEVIQRMLAGGTPDWVRFPREFANMAREEKAAMKERSEAMAAPYKWEDQDVLTNRQARMINAISTRDFVQKLRSKGVKCFTIDNGFPPQTVALWAIPPDKGNKARYVCYLQVPAMYEWSVLKLDRMGIPSGEEFRGWRTVCVQLVQKQIISEAQLHAWFGVPSPNEISNRYFRSLWETRHRRKYVDPEESI
jgi:hypothetical protein